MISYLVDTSVIIDYLRGKERAVSLLNSLEGDFFSSYVCLAELYEGVYRANNKKKTTEIIANFFATLSGIYGLNEEVAKKFGEIRADLKQKGTIIEDLDLMLGATCIVHDLTLITFNQKHFSHIKTLRLYPIS